MLIDKLKSLVPKSKPGYFKWADRQLQDLIAKIPQYKRSTAPGLQLGLASSLMGSRMPGSAMYERNLLTSQGNTLGGVERVATDASQALAMGAVAQGQTDQSLTDFALQEADWKKFGLQNLNQAYGAMADEDRIVEQDKIRQYEDLVSLKGAQAANKFAKRKALWNTVGSIANLGVGALTGGIKLPKLGGGGTGGDGISMDFLMQNRTGRRY